MASDGGRQAAHRGRRPTSFPVSRTPNSEVTTSPLADVCPLLLRSSDRRRCAMNDALTLRYSYIDYSTERGVLMRRWMVIFILPLILLTVPSTASAAGKPGAQHSPAGHKNPLVTRSASVSAPVTLWVGMLETQGENPKAAPDWNITGSGLTTVPAGTSVLFAQYFQIYKGPTQVNLTYTDNVNFNGKSVSSKTASGTLTNNPNDDWRHTYGPLTLNKAGTYTYWCTITIGGTSFSDRGTIVVR